MHIKIILASFGCVKSKSSHYSCMVDEDDKYFDIGLVSQHFCDSEMEQESTNTDKGNEDLFDSDGKENDNMSMYLISKSHKKCSYKQIE